MKKSRAIAREHPELGVLGHWRALGGVGGLSKRRVPSPGRSRPISARLGGGEGLWPTLLGTLEGPSRRRDPLEGGGPLRGGKAAAVTKLDVKARETQVAVVPPRPSPPPPCQSLTRASSWTACAWQGRHMRAWARARAWSGKARASWGPRYGGTESRPRYREPPKVQRAAQRKESRPAYGEPPSVRAAGRGRSRRGARGRERLPKGRGAFAAQPCDLHSKH